VVAAQETDTSAPLIDTVALPPLPLWRCTLTVTVWLSSLPSWPDSWLRITLAEDDVAVHDTEPPEAVRVREPDVPSPRFILAGLTVSWADAEVRAAGPCRAGWELGGKVTVTLRRLTWPGTVTVRLAPWVPAPTCLPLATASAPPAADGEMAAVLPCFGPPWPGVEGGASGRGIGVPVPACDGAADPVTSRLSDPLSLVCPPMLPKASPAATAIAAMAAPAPANTRGPGRRRRSGCGCGWGWG
jgi:hypothetical protein